MGRPGTVCSVRIARGEAGALDQEIGSLKRNLDIDIEQYYSCHQITLAGWCRGDSMLGVAAPNGGISR